MYYIISVNKCMRLSSKKCMDRFQTNKNTYIYIYCENIFITFFRLALYFQYVLKKIDKFFFRYLFAYAYGTYVISDR